VARATLFAPIPTQHTAFRTRHQFLGGPGGPREVQGLSKYVASGCLERYLPRNRLTASDAMSSNVSHKSFPPPRILQEHGSAALGLTPARLKLSRRSVTAGFTLTEVALAMGIFSFALVSMIGLLSVGLKNSRRANVQIAASNLMSAIASDIQSSSWLVRGGTLSYTSPRLRLAATLDSKGNVSGVAPANTILDEGGSPVLGTTQVPLTKAFNVIFSAASEGTAAIRVTLQWPASAATTPAKAPEGSLDALIPLPTP
jgi:uncharacterized protein (TIGR02598 family)